MNNNPDHHHINPAFLNKDDLKPIVTKAPFERIQIDLVDFSKNPSYSNGKHYHYILSVLDVFSRFLFLQPLEKKESSSVACVLMNLFYTFGYPEEIQSDQGGEFKGILHRFLSNLI